MNIAARAHRRAAALAPRRGTPAARAASAPRTTARRTSSRGSYDPAPSDIEVRDLQVRLRGGQVLLDGVSFNLPRSSLLAVIGPSGAGKTTLLRALTGSRAIAAGQVLIEGRPLAGDDELRRRIGVVPQDDVVHRHLTVRQALTYAAELRLPRDLTDTERILRIHGVVGELGLVRHLDTRIDRLSGGQRKRVSVAMELLSEPALLFLDEPTSGLDPSLDHSVMRTLRELADTGRSVVVTTHSVTHLHLCDLVLILAPGGRVAYFGPPEQVLPTFGMADYSEVFYALHRDPEAISAAYAHRATAPAPLREHRTRHRPWRRSLPEVPARAPHVADGARPIAHPANPPRSAPRQLGTLIRRHVRVLLADRMYAVFTAALPIVLAALVMTVPGGAGLGTGADPPTNEPIQTLLILILGAAFMGVATTSRDLIGERPIYRRERAVGLSPGAYLTAKVVVFGALSLTQSAVLVGLVLLAKPGPDGAAALSALDWPMIPWPGGGLEVPTGAIELYAAVAVTAFTCATLGLLLSACVSTTEQIMPLLVIVIMCQLVLSGGLLPVADRTPLEQLAWFSPSRWGYAAAAGTVDIVGKVPVQPERSLDPLWRTDAATWWRCLGLLGVGAMGTLAGTAGVLRRRPDRG